MQENLCSCDVMEKYGKYANTTEKINDFCDGVVVEFGHFQTKLFELYSENFPFISKLVEPVYMDYSRLECSVESAFIDIKRYADYHQLFVLNKEGLQRLNICEHKIAGFVARWFMAFTPVIIPPYLMDEIIDTRKRYVSESNQEGVNATKKMHGDFLSMNERFILDYVLRKIIFVPPQNIIFLGQEEHRDLLYMLRYRSGRLQGVDLSLLFHWIQQALTERPAKTAALHSALSHFDDDSNNIFRQKLRQALEDAKKMLPNPD